MKKIRFLVSNELLKMALHMPEDAQIANVEFITVGYHAGALRFTVEVESLQGEDSIAVDTTPIITHKQEEFLWDWNLPGEKQA